MSPCVINPKTGKPYTKHKLVANLGVCAYYRGAYGDQKPIFTHEVKCARGCGR